MTDNRIQEIQAQFIRNRSIMRTSQLRKGGIYSRDIQSLLEENLIVRLKDGYYAWKDQLDQLSDYLIATATISNATICFISAASLYGLTTVIPDAVHIAIPNTGRMPLKPYTPPIELIPFKPSVFLLGKTVAQTDFGVLPIYDKERTVCDCLKRRDEVGDDIALEIIKNYMRGKKDIQRLYMYAQKLRIQQKLHPYVEALT